MGITIEEIQTKDLKLSPQQLLEGVLSGSLPTNVSISSDSKPKALESLAAHAMLNSAG